jgi:hypothetical protein
MTKRNLDEELYPFRADPCALGTPQSARPVGKFINIETLRELHRGTPFSFI